MSKSSTAIRKTRVKSPLPPPVVETIEERSLPKVVDRSYVRYSTHAIKHRAIPDARDGLKPVQRRLLFTMDVLGLKPGGKHHKSAKVCGQCSGDYHPHGESVIYPTLVRLAQDWVMRYPLIDGQGNFGTVDGLSPAAMRYTEVRLAEAGFAAIDDVSEDAVDYLPNYTESLKEPTVMPSLLPNLLCNGGAGIAVGVACSFAPHNLREVAAVIREVATNSRVTVERIMELMPGPDFPTGGVLRGQTGVRQYYETGRGTVTLDGAWQIDEDSKSRRLTVVELPHGASPDKFAQEVAALVQAKKLEGVTDLKELSHRKDGIKHIKVCLTLAKSADTDLVVNTLLKHTCLRKTFSANHTVIIDGEAKEGVSIAELARAYINHRTEVTTRRCDHELSRIKRRLHIIEGLVLACSRIKEVVETVYTSDNPEHARTRLVEAGYVATHEQAEAVLELSLRRLTKLEASALESEASKLSKRATQLEHLLGSKKAMLNAVLAELDTLVKRLGDDRRTAIGPEPETLSVSKLVRDEPVTVVLTRDGYVRRVPRGQSVDAQPSDWVLDTTSLQDVVVFTSSGFAYRKPAHELPEPGKSKRGSHLAQVVNLTDADKPVAIFTADTLSKEKMILATTGGSIKRVDGTSFDLKQKNRPSIATKLREGDTLAFVFPCRASTDIMVVTSLGRAIRYPVSNVPVMGRAATGVTAMKLSVGDCVAQVAGVDADAEFDLVCVTAQGFAKKTPSSLYRCYSGRVAVGRIAIDGLKADRQGLVVGAAPVPAGGSFAVLLKSGECRSYKASQVRASDKPARLPEFPPDDVATSVA